MSLYNLVAGTNPMAKLIIAIFRFKPEMVPRFRDAWFTDDGKQAILLTRTGGGNREDYGESYKLLTALPEYVSDRDDTFDSTFAHFTFAVPEVYQADAAIVAKYLTALNFGADKNGPRAAVARVTGEWAPNDRPYEEMEVAVQAFQRMLEKAAKEYA